MREIKFRQRNVNNGTWHYWGYIDGAWIQPLTQDNYYSPELSDQYTGLKDKNGKEIYEGDILKVTSDKGTEILAVNYFMGNACYFFPGQETGSAIYPHLINMTKEIIGNIYENPELINDAS